MRVALSTVVALAAIAYLGVPAMGQYGQSQAPPQAPVDGGGQPYGADGPGLMQPGAGGDDDLIPGIGQSQGPLMTAEEHDAFADNVDVSSIRRLAVFHGGRAKILDTLARETMQNIHGRTRYQRPRGDPQYTFSSDGGMICERDEALPQRSYDPVFTFLDLVLNGDYYLERPLLHVSHVEVRRAMMGPIPEYERERLMRIGRIPPRLLGHPEVAESLEPFQRETIRQRQLNSVMFAAQTYIEAGNTLNLVSPNPGDDRWPHLRELAGDASEATTRRGEDALIEMAAYGAGGAELNGRAVETFRELGRAWRQGDAPAVNALLEELAEILPQINPETYPSAFHRNLEYAYNATRHFTYSYLAYFAAFVALLIAFATGWTKALVTGGVLLTLGFLGHSLGLFARIALSDRPWTIHNQYESFIMLIWFTTLAGLILLVVKRQWIFGAAGAAISGVMLMIANQVPIPSSEIAPQPAILATSNILFVHVNIMIIAYALISLALVLGLFYLYTYYSSSDSAVKMAAAGLEPTNFSGGAAVATGGGGATGDDPEQQNKAVRNRAALLNDLDQAQMVVIQIIFWTLAVGILLGAYWADHSWGRWWAWDPKETWALILWIVYLVTIHLRFAVKRRALVTAWLAVLGFFTMLWTHWGVNLLLSGLHSYA